MKFPSGTQSGYYYISQTNNGLPFRQRQKNKRKRMEAMKEGRPAYLPQGQFAPRAIGRGYNNPAIINAHQEILVQRTQAFVRASDGSGNAQAAVALRAMLRSTASLMS